MALTRIDHTGDGTTTQYDITFDLGYLRKEFVYVYLEGNDYETQLSYSWINSTRIQLDTPVANGVSFHIRRVIPRNQPVNDYEKGAILREDNLDDSFLQAIMILQEIEDGYFTEGDVPWNIPIVANFLNEVTIQEPTNGNNPATKDYVDNNDEAYLLTAQEWVRNYSYSKSESDRNDQATLEEANKYTDQKVYDTYVNDSPVSIMVAGRQIADGVNRVFFSPASKLDRTDNFLVYVDGIYQKPTLDFSINSSGNVVFLNEAPPLNAEVDVSYMNANILNLEGVDGVIPHDVPRIVANGIQTDFDTGTGTQIPDILFTVTIDGVVQRQTLDYYCNTTGFVVFHEAPPANADVDIRWFQPNLVSQLNTANPVLMFEQTINQDLVVAPPYNGLSVSPTVADGVQVTVATGSTYVVL